MKSGGWRSRRESASVRVHADGAVELLGLVFDFAHAPVAHVRRVMDELAEVGMAVVVVLDGLRHVYMPHAVGLEAR